MPKAPSSASRRWLPVALSLALLAVTAWFVDLTVVVTALGQLDPAWVVASLALQGAQVIVLAVRWHWVSQRLQLPLPFRKALAEYTLSTSLNLLLPGGFAGDVTRAVRQSLGTGPDTRMRVWVGVVADRALGQLGLWVLAATSIGWWLPRKNGSPFLGLLALVGVTAVVAGITAWLARRHHNLAAALVSLLKELRRPRSVALQLTLASALASAWVASFYCASRALGFETSALAICRAAVPVLLAASIPGFVNGWGPREGAAALAYGWAGLSQTEGSTVSVTYGLVGLILAVLGLSLSLPFKPDSRGARKATLAMLVAVLLVSVITRSVWPTLIALALWVPRSLMRRSPR